MTKQIMVVKVPVGGGAPVAIQSMCSTHTDDVAATVAQIHRLEAAGCEIVRVAVPDMAAAKAIGAIKEQISIPLVVDIHFNYKLALECIAAGADKVRINPGNIGGEDRVKAVADACRQKNIPIRIGWPSTARSAPRPWWSLPSATSGCSTSSILTISASPSSPPACRSLWPPTGC